MAIKFRSQKVGASWLRKVKPKVLLIAPFTSLMKDLSYEQKKQALIEEITAAFDGVSREGGVSLSEAWVIDDYGSDEGRAEARKHDTETRWQDVLDEDICHGDFLFLMDEIGFHYYIPAYIVWYLRYIDSKDSNDPNYDLHTFEYLISTLGALNNGDLDQYELRRFKLFTHKESKAVAHFLQFAEARMDEYIKKYERNFINSYVPVNDARKALERYWEQFL